MVAALKIQMSHNTYVALEDKTSYVITERGEIEVKVSKHFDVVAFLLFIPFF